MLVYIKLHRIEHNSQECMLWKCYLRVACRLTSWGRVRALKLYIKVAWELMQIEWMKCGQLPISPMGSKAMKEEGFTVPMVPSGRSWLNYLSTFHPLSTALALKEKKGIVGGMKQGGTKLEKRKRPRKNDIIRDWSRCRGGQKDCIWPQSVVPKLLHSGNGFGNTGEFGTPTLTWHSICLTLSCFDSEVCGSGSLLGSDDTISSAIGSSSSIQNFLNISSLLKCTPRNGNNNK